MITISEVGNPGKLASRALSIARGAGFFFAAAALLFSSEVLASEAPANGLSMDRRLGDCNWQVTYRGRVYDLSPLTRTTLSRPIENDIRFVLERVPEAAQRLNAMNGHLSAAKTHTILASIFISGFLVTKLLESRLKNERDRPDYQIAEAATGAFFLASTFFSWRSSTRAKEELVHAVEEFNSHSPYPIEPTTGHSLEQGATKP